MRSIFVCLLLVSGAAEAAVRLPLRAGNRLDETRRTVPVTWSAPLGMVDQVIDTTRLRLTRNGAPVAAQFTPLARWGGRVTETSKPVSWLLIDTQLDLEDSATAELMLEEGTGSTVPSALRVLQDDATALVITTGAATYRMSKQSFRLFDSVTLATGETFSPGGGIRFNGRNISSPATLSIEHVGNERISVIGRGAIEGQLEYSIRLHFYRDLAEVRIDFRLENLTPPLFDGQPRSNDYGSPGSVSLDDLSVVLPTRGGGSYESPESRGSFTRAISIVQESSGDENWDFMRDLAPRLQSGVMKRASTIRVDDTVTDGPNRIAGWLDAGGVTVAVERAWQNFPKAFRATTSAIEIGLFPGEYSRNHELRAGEFKTHTMWIRHHTSGAADVAPRARSFSAPVRLLPPIEHISRSLAVGLMAPRMDAAFSDYERGVDYQIVESPEWRAGEYDARTILEAISQAQSYGWVDYGDIPTDFEVATSPYNMKYDALRGLLLQALRSDNETWWELGSAAARHVADIDVHHARVRGHDTPRVWFEGGIYGHGFHYEDGRTNPHRNYMNPSSSMAGPSAGLFVWGLITGDTLILDSARETADNLYWKSSSTNYDEFLPGASSCAREARLQLCDGDCQGFEAADQSRTGGNIVQAMIAGYQATGEPAYLELISRLARYIECLESRVMQPTCNRFHFQSIFVRNIGHYLILRDALGMPPDQPARNLLARRMDYMTGTLWDPTTQQFRMCYFDDVVDTTLNPIQDNWLFSIADAFAVGARVLNRPELLTAYGASTLRYGAANQFYAGSANSYHSTKEFVNQVGFGQMFLATWWQTNNLPTRRRAVR